MKKIILLLQILITVTITAQGDPYADSVIYFEKGIGSWTNQEPPYFPDNVLGAPSENATWTIPETSPDEICSLGLGGEIVLAFTDNAIVNGDGVDFTVFENAFEILYGTRAGEIFAEPAKVAVSKDGITFYEFPFDSLTLEGLAGKTPTNGSADPANPDSSGGDSFDLSVVGLDTAYFVKLTDVTEIILQDTSHPYYDPTANGFDLDAVVAVHSVITSVRNEAQIQNSSFTLSVPYPSPASKSSTNSISFKVNGANGKVNLRVYDILGRRIFSKQISASTQSLVKIPIQNFSTGVYFIYAENRRQIQRQKFLIIR